VHGNLMTEKQIQEKVFQQSEKVPILSSVLWFPQNVVTEAGH